VGSVGGVRGWRANIRGKDLEVAMADDEDGAETQPEEPAAGEEDDTKRRFRQALERKQQRHHATAEGAARDGSEKSHGAEGPTKGRAFRRKSV